MSMKKETKDKILNVVLNVLIAIFGVILVISSYTIMQTKIMKKEYSDFFGYTLFEVQSNSMKDAILAGDWIVVKITKDVKLNDIITYKHGNEFITHRAIEIKNKHNLITRGDNNPQKDDPVHINQVVGKVVKVLGNFGLIKQIVFNPFVILALVTTIFMFNNIFKENKKDEIMIKKLKGFIKFKKKTKEKDTPLVYETKEETLEKEKELFQKIKHDLEEEEKFEKKLEQEVNTKLKETKMEEVMNLDILDEDNMKLQEETSDEVLNEEDPKKIEEDLEKELSKTAMFRMISVDKEEVSKTLLEVEEHEIIEDEEPVKKKVEKVIEVEEETLTDIDLSLLENKDDIRYDTNIITTTLNIKEDELNQLIDIIVKYDHEYTERVTIKNDYMKLYIDNRYNNFFVEGATNRKSIIRLRASLNDLHKKIDKRRNVTDQTKEINIFYKDLFVLLADIEHSFDQVDQKAKRDELLVNLFRKYRKTWENEKINFLIKNITSIKKHYEDKTKDYLESFDTKTFDLILENVTGERNMQAARLEHNIAFSNIYSEFIINKTYSEGIIAEDKLQILLTMLSVEIINDMYNAHFNKSYVIELPTTLYSKTKKIERILRLVDNKYALNNVLIVITNKQLRDHKVVIKNLHKKGYKFALLVEEKNAPKTLLVLVDRFFANTKEITKKRVNEILPKMFSKLVIYDDILNRLKDTEE